MSLPDVWSEKFKNHEGKKLELLGAEYSRLHELPQDLSEWDPEALRNRIRAALGVTIDHSLPLNVYETGTVRRDGYSIKKICYQSRKDFYVTANLYVPDGDGPFPGVINMHGHHSNGHIAARVQERGHALARKGYVCLIPDAFGSGERGTVHGEWEYHGFCLGLSLLNLGETLMGIQVVDNMRGVDLLCSLPYVDPGRIGATGASGGGNQTMWLTAMDERIKASGPVVSVGSFESYIMTSNCVCELLPSGLTFTEEAGVLALIAPRALKICNAL
ncbi:MAG: acetylxylan esterase, partial [Lentisphaeria bacterium]|nr:acetylxylan esterase [Lentisphaeria bacterium]